MFQEAGLGCIPGGGASVERLLSYVGVVALVDLLSEDSTPNKISMLD